MTWNYRIILHDEGKIKYYAVHEVFYDEKGKPDSCTLKPIDILNDSVRDIKESVKMIAKDIQKPVLKYSYFKEMEE